MVKIVGLETTNKTMLFNKWNDNLQLSFKIDSDDLFTFKDSIDITIDKSGFILEDNMKFETKEVYGFIQDTMKLYGKEIYSSLKEIDMKAEKLREDCYDKRDKKLKRKEEYELINELNKLDNEFKKSKDKNKYREQMNKLELSYKEVRSYNEAMSNKCRDDIKFINELVNKHANEYLDFMFNKYINK